MKRNILFALLTLLVAPAFAGGHTPGDARSPGATSPGDRSYNGLTPQDSNVTVRIIRYKLKADRVAGNERLINAVFGQLREKKLAGVKYTVYKLADGVSFVHIISYSTEEAHKAFTNMPAFQAFQAQAKDRFEEAPVTIESEEIGAYSPAGS